MPSISSTATPPIPTTPSTCLAAAERGGARWIVLCDTNGGRLPHEIARAVERVPG